MSLLQPLPPRSPRPALPNHLAPVFFPCFSPLPIRIMSSRMNHALHPFLRADPSPGAFDPRETRRPVASLDDGTGMDAPSRPAIRNSNAPSWSPRPMDRQTSESEVMFSGRSGLGGGSSSGPSRAMGRNDANGSRTVAISPGLGMAFWSSETEEGESQ